ncbi:hypothetical protein KIH74_31600 [Kineosporia sp. J2-2]|uniref:Saccharopine dehydrogenase n=1 Tax=Kineosporia corallincola TaxID=2835133 RepID=A0ABS5TRW3_9ACTN|nr:hypothetical protein [Kineosporia corallincola]MBT0773533.1 hypothetical protein [Kineosporia corallincola]
MKALVLGARGAVGRVVTAELLRTGNDVVPAGRTAVPGGVRIALPGEEGLDELERVAAEVDVVVNASGVEDPRIGGRTGSTPLVEISATASYLERLAGPSVLLGAGLVPGLSTVLVSALEPEPDDEIDVLVMLGSGEAHGAAAVAWTAGLIGTDIHDPAEGGTVPNLRSGRTGVGPDGRRRRYLRADFPDRTLTGLRVRSYLTLSSRAATSALAVVARAPRLRGLIANSPHLGSSDWHVIAVSRGTGRSLSTWGTGQSETTGLLTALAAVRVAGAPPAGVVSMDAVVTLDDVLGLRTPVGGVVVSGSSSSPVPASESLDL